jgi:hypothetical protein
MCVVARLGDVGGDGEVDAERILARDDLAGHIDIVADEGILGFGDHLAIEPDRRDAVDALQRQREVAVDIGLLRVEAALDRPGGLVDPHDRLLVVAEIGVGDLTGFQ